jgi:hypothetical protein
MKHITTFIFIFYSFLLFAQNQSPLVFTGKNGKLEYTKYANTGQSEVLNQIPDFSWAGYKSGGVKLPSVPVVLTVNAVEGDNRANIQQAIDQVSAMPINTDGIRGAILFKAGRYECSAPVNIQTSGIILRGEGQMPAQSGGTQFVATAAKQHTLINFIGTQSSSVSSDIMIDTIYVPQMRIGDFNNDGKKDTIDGDVWLSANLTQAARLEFENDKIMSLRIVANNGDFSSYHSKEDVNKPYLKISYKLSDSGRDSVVSVFPTDDAFVQGGEYSTDNFGSDTRLVVKNSGEGNRVTRKTYLKFSLPSLLAEIKGAELWLWCNNAGNTSVQDHYVSLVSNDNWNESTLNYNNQPISSIQNDRILTGYVPVGANTLEVENAGKYKPGDRIVVLRTPNDAWIDTLDMAQYGWTADSYEVGYERTVMAVTGNKITVDAPMVQSIETRFGGGEIYKINKDGRIDNCGIENMFISSTYANDEDENHGWIAVSLSNTENCWVKNVTAQYFGYGCVELVWANNTTVEECAMLDHKSITTGGRKYSFNIEKGSFNLFQRCYTRGGRHDYATGSRVAGPNVFVDCFSEQTNADIGPHHRYATGILFDNIKGGQTRVQNRKDMGSGHGWAGAQTMFWNIEAVNNDIKVESPFGAMNWGIGCIAPVKSGSGYWDNWGKHVVPRSLYLKQLEDRLGVEAVENITTCQQRESNIWDYLEQWKGIGKWLSDNAQLNDIKVNGVSIDDFDPQRTDYIYSLPSGTNEIPEIKYSTADSLASVIIKNASSIPGSSEIAVTAENGITKKVYSVKFTYTTGVSDISKDSFKVYPNPVTSLLCIESASSSVNSIFTLSSIDGKIMIQWRCTSKKQQIDLTRLDSGMYFLNIEGMSNAIKLFKQ